MPPKKTRTPVNKLWFTLLELIGLGLSFYLFLVSAALVPTPPCVRNSIFACTSIIRGNFGHFGPFSVAAMGIVYYLGQLALTAGLKDRAAQLTKALLVFGGLIFIAWLRALELIYIREICPWCWGVALITLIHAGLVYGLVSPPLPKLRPAGIAALVFASFIVLIGLVSVVELGTKVGKKLQNLGTTDSGSSGTPSNAPIAGPGADDTPPAPAKTPKPKPTATPRPSPTPAVQVTEASPTPAPSVTPAPTPAATETPALDFDPEPKVDDSEEVRILRKRGWRHAGSDKSIIKAIKVQPPVLALAYDPHCADCHRLITQTLDRDVMNSLHVTRICIQESMLGGGDLNKMVTALPTVLLFDAQGNVIMKQVGSRITAEELVKKVNDALAAAAK